MGSDTAKKKLLDLGLSGSVDKMPDNEKYLREKGWEKAYTESGGFIGWYHSDRHLSRVFSEYEAIAIQKEHDYRMDNTRIKEKK